MKIVKKGQMFWAKKEINSGDPFVVFYYAKLAKDMYLVTVGSVFTKDPIKWRYAIVSERKFRNLSKGCSLQESV